MRGKARVPTPKSIGHLEAPRFVFSHGFVQLLVVLRGDALGKFLGALLDDEAEVFGGAVVAVISVSLVCSAKRVVVNTETHQIFSDERFGHPGFADDFLKKARMPHDRLVKCGRLRFLQVAVFRS